MSEKFLISHIYYPKSFRSPQPPFPRGAKSLAKSPKLGGDLGGSKINWFKNILLRHPLSKERD
jgi:hypothetical protein